MMPPKDFPVSQLRMVKLRFKDSKDLYSQDQLMHESQVETFVKAKLELHWEPGINPHSKLKPAVMWEIRVAHLSSPISHWHTSPGLHAGDEGAYVMPTYSGERLWAHPDLLANEKRSEEIEAQYD